MKYLVLKRSSHQILDLRKFEEELTHEDALELVLNAMGSKLLSLKEPVLSEYYKCFMLDIFKFEKYFRSLHPQVFLVKGVSLFEMVGQVYGDKTAISIKRLL